MATSSHLNLPLVSVIIPCYNHGAYLTEAVESVWQQQYSPTEIIVIDDGSKDYTKEVAAKLKDVKYIYQQNQGLSAARNTGIKNSRGEFLIFLDADDWLLQGAIHYNAEQLLSDPKLAFVSGAHEQVFIKRNITNDIITKIDGDHYINLLKGNYIGMHGTVMYRRWVFDELLFDTSLRMCEDYDLYLKIARKYPVAHYTRKQAAYRLHDENMSNNIQKMLSAVLLVLNRQKNGLASPAEKNAFNFGLRNWKKYYCRELSDKLIYRKLPWSFKNLFIILKYRPSFLFRLLPKITTMLKSSTKKSIKKIIPSFAFKGLKKIGLHNSYIPEPGHLSLGDLNSITPVSSNFGYERGGPIDRYYIENFLAAEANTIRGRVLEIGDNEYTLKFGKERIVKSDILHVNERNPNATIIGDISNAPQIADNTFDCIVLTQTLHLIYNFKDALATCYRILKPGGALLLTVPGITPIDHGEWKETWYWSFTDKALQKLFEEMFFNSKIEINTFGNVYAAVTFVAGLGLSEVSAKKLDFKDPYYQVINTVKAIKA